MEQHVITITLSGSLYAIFLGSIFFSLFRAKIPPDTFFLQERKETLEEKKQLRDIFFGYNFPRKKISFVHIDITQALYAYMTIIMCDDV